VEEKERKNRGSKTLPYPEYVKRREEGRCFHCGGAYSYGHRSPDKNLHVVICGDSEEEKKKGDMQGFEEDSREELDRNNRGSSMSLSVLPVGGLTPPQTMKMVGKGGYGVD